MGSFFMEPSIQIKNKLRFYECMKREIILITATKFDFYFRYL